MISNIRTGALVSSALLAAVLFARIYRDRSIPARRFRASGGLAQRRRTWTPTAPFADPKSVEKKAMGTETNDGFEGRPLIHVFNPFRYLEDSGFSPLGFEQWAMLASVRRAKENFSSLGPPRHQMNDNERDRAFDEVVVVCAVLEDEAAAMNEVLSLYCDHIIPLPRSAATEYPSLHLKSLPFVQDIIDIGMAVGAMFEDYYLMLTNSDICLTEEYYTHLGGKLTETDVKAMVVNRMTIVNFREPRIVEGSSLEAIHEAATNILQQAKRGYASGRFKNHPGVDTFIFHPSILQMIHFGNLFLGYPPFDWNVKLIMEIFDANFRTVGSNERGTFHFGNEQSWIQAGENDLSQLFGPADPILETLESCPRMFNVPLERHALQNGINCGGLFRQEAPNAAPGFVRAGYENVYRQMFVSRGVRIGDYGRIGQRTGMKHFLHNPKHPYRSNLIARFG